MESEPGAREVKFNFCSRACVTSATVCRAGVLAKCLAVLPSVASTRRHAPLTPLVLVLTPHLADCSATVAAAPYALYMLHRT